MKKWEIISKEDVSPSKWFPIEKHVVKLPNGKIIDDYYVSTMENVAMILPITTENKIVLVKQYKHAIDEIMIELPAGCQKEEKTLEDTAIIELEEEVGIKTTKDNLVLLGKIIDNPTKSTRTTFCYLAKDLEFNSKQKLDETEDIEIMEVAPKQALKMVENGDIWTATSVATIVIASLKYPEIFK